MRNFEAMRTTMRDGHNSGPVNLHGYRPTQKRNGNDNSLAASEIDEDAFQAAQGLILNANSLSNLQIRPRFQSKT